MKKILSFCFVVLGLFCLTGCGKNSLSCSRDNDYSDEMKMYQEIKVTFRNDRVRRLSMNMNVKLSGEYTDFKGSLLESVESEFSKLPDKGVKYSSSDTKDGFNFKVKINFGRLSDDAKKEIGVIDYESSYDAIRESLEDSGYTCK